MAGFYDFAETLWDCMFVCVGLLSSQVIQGGWEVERGMGPVTGAVRDLKGCVVCRSTSRSTPRGNLMFLPVYKSKQICNHWALAPVLGHQCYN